MLLVIKEVSNMFTGSSLDVVYMLGQLQNEPGEQIILCVELFF
jgi:hypothetical protein